MELKSKSNVVFDLSINTKQQAFFEEVFKTVAGKSDLRYFFYGGAVRGGKTAVSVTILVLLAKKFPGSRWHIIRDSFTTLKATTIPSFEKFCPENSRNVERYNRNPSDYYVEFTNGSKIFFASESFYSDPELTWMLGLETNGIMLEQIEGLQKETWQKALERVGSWYIDPMPPGLILSTFNPTQKWIKSMIYDPFRKGELKAPYYYCQALPTDNPMVTEDQWNAWKQMDDVSYKRFIEGDWDSFAIEKPFAYAYSETKHTGRVQYDPNHELYLSFDFNRDPMTAIAVQHINNEIRVIKAYKIAKSNTYDLCDRIKVDFPNALYIITGDASGKAGSAMVKDNINHYTIIKGKFDLVGTQLRVPAVNPSIEENRVLVNSILQHYKVVIDGVNAVGLHFDLKYVEVNDEADIIKDRSSEAAKADLLDCFRYYLNTFHKNFLKMREVQ